MTHEILTPSKATTKINKILDTVYPVVSDRFPVNIDNLAKSIHQLFHWNDPISQMESANIEGFEGALFKNNDKSWTILYNNNLLSKERVTFTKAHELGHYILHRLRQEEFMCSKNSIDDADENTVDIESEANQFASNLLIHTADFRKQTDRKTLSIDMLSDCAHRYGVSLTAILMKWVDLTEDNVVVILSIDGYIRWARSSKKAFRANAVFATRKRSPIPIPESSLCANELISHCSDGVAIKTNIWFHGVPSHGYLTEYKLRSEKFDQTITILKLPRNEDVWGTREN